MAVVNKDSSSLADESKEQSKIDETKKTINTLRNNTDTIGSTIKEDTAFVNYNIKTTGVESGIFTDDIIDESDMGTTFWSNNIYNRKDIQWYTKFNRFGCLDPFNAVSNSKEYLFFTKPDLHICEPGTMNLNPELANQDYFVELLNRYPDVIRQLQRSISSGSSNHYPFVNLLSNSVKNNLDMPEISSDDTDTPATLYGTSITYRGTGWTSDENFDFSLEFEDTRYLEIYHFFKAWEEYERLKAVGVVSPPNINNAPVDDNGLSFNSYLENKELHDQIGIYKIVTDEDYETIMYYAYMICYPKSVPREAFSELQLGNGLRYTVNFHGQFVMDTNPRLLIQFNKLAQETSGLVSGSSKFIDSYDTSRHAVDGRWAVSPWVVRSMKNDVDQWLGPNSMKYDYKLKWRLK